MNTNIWQGEKVRLRAVEPSDWEAFHAFDKQLTEAKVPHEMHIYEGAPHSFFDRTYEQWKDACDDAWRRMLAFIQEHS